MDSMDSAEDELDNLLEEDPYEDGLLIVTGDDDE